MYFIVPINNGLLDIDYSFMREGFGFSEAQAVIWTRDDAPGRDSWQELTESQYLANYGAGYCATDKFNIVTDGVDTAIVTATVDVSLLEVSFYNTTNGELIITQPVNTETHTAILQVTATNPGTIRIRAGRETQTRMNEVIINAI